MHNVVIDNSVVDVSAINETIVLRIIGVERLRMNPAEAEELADVLESYARIVRNRISKGDAELARSVGVEPAPDSGKKR